MAPPTVPRGLYPSAAHGVLFRKSNRFYTYTKGKLKVAHEYVTSDRLLWGRKGFQPYEAAVLKTHSRDLVAVVDRHLAVRNGQGKLEQTDPLPRYASNLTRAWKHGFWTDYQAAPTYRILGRRLIECDWGRCRQGIRGRSHRDGPPRRDGAGCPGFVARQGR